MSDEQKQFLQKLVSEQLESARNWTEYWFQYSHMGTWQFWFNIVMLVVPLIFLYFFLDRKKALHIGFFGFNIHVWFTYVDVTGARFGFWSYPYQSIPFIPVSFGLDVSFMPVVFMLIYQYALNNDKNFYLYALGMSALHSFVIKPIMYFFDLFHLYRGTEYYHLFLLLIPILVVSKWITRLFLKFEKGKV
jgi:hypothetical protein